MRFVRASSPILAVALAACGGAIATPPASNSAGADAGVPTSAIPRDGGSAPPQWPTMGGSATRDGRARAVAGTGGAEREWTVTASGRASGVVLAGDSTAYFADTAGLHAVAADGTPRWTLPAAGCDASPSPAIDQDGTIFVACGSELRAVSPEGKALPQRSASIGASIDTAPAIAPDGTIYVAAADGALYAVRVGGDTRWTARLLGSIGRLSSPSIGPSGTVYVIDYVSSGEVAGTFLYALHPDGKHAWSPWRCGTCETAVAPVISSDETVYVAETLEFSAVSSTGKFKWSASLPHPALALGQGDAIYASAPAFALELSAFQPDGSRRWTAGPVRDGYPPYPLAVRQDGNIVVADTEVRTFDTSGTLVGSTSVGRSIVSLALGAGGMAYATTNALEGENAQIVAVRTP